MKALEFPLSSIAAERAFAIARKIDITVARRTDDVGDVLAWGIHSHQEGGCTRRAFLAYKASMVWHTSSLVSGV
jgi:hypothetical protein